jgi:enoyl-CoA hydratase
MSDIGDPRIELAIDDGVALIHINRPEKQNALDANMIAALERTARLIDTTVAVRAAIITGAGQKSFCAGGDIGAWSKESAQDFALQWIRLGHRAFDALSRLRVPLIAALNGSVLGGGMELAVTADYRIAEEHAVFGLPETGLGVIPGWSGTQRVARRFGSQIARRMAVFGETFTAPDAQRLGLCDAVVAKGGAVPAARAMCEKLKTRSSVATQVTKALINAADGEDREAALEMAASLGIAATPELMEGLAAFREKRKPRF